MIRTALRVGLALFLAILLAIAGGIGTIALGFALLALLATVYAELVTATRWLQQ